MTEMSETAPPNSRHRYGRLATIAAVAAAIGLSFYVLNKLTVSFWVNLLVCFGALRFAMLEHSEALLEYRESTDQTERRLNGFKLFLLWALPAGTLIASVISGFESMASDRTSRAHVEAVSLATNKLAKAETKLLAAEQRIEELAPSNQVVATVVARAELTITGTTNFAEFVRIEASIRRQQTRGSVFGPPLEFRRSSDTNLNLIEFRLIYLEGQWYPNSQTGQTKITIDYFQDNFRPNWNLPTNATVGYFDQFDRVTINAWRFFDTNLVVLDGKLTVIFNGGIQKVYPIPRQRPIEDGRRIEYVKERDDIPNVLVAIGYAPPP